MNREDAKDGTRSDARDLQGRATGVAIVAVAFPADSLIICHIFAGNRVR